MKLIALFIFAVLVIMWGVGLITGTYYEAHSNPYWVPGYNAKQDMVMTMIIGFLLLVVPILLMWRTKK